MRTDGYAAAVQPAAQTQVQTPADGLEAGAIRLGEIPAYSAKPQGAGPFPILLVVPEIFGLPDRSPSPAASGAAGL